VCFAFGRYLESRVAKQREKALRLNYEALIESHVEERNIFKDVADAAIAETDTVKKINAALANHINANKIEVKETVAIDALKPKGKNPQDFNAIIPTKVCPHCAGHLFKLWVYLKETRKVTWECLGCHVHFEDGEL
jgi:hypothetical protein